MRGQPILFRRRRWPVWISFLSLSTLVSITLSLNLGYAQIPFDKVLLAIWHNLPFLGTSQNPAGNLDETIVFQIRLPRVIAAASVGAALATAGVVFQAIFRNSMADPFVIGASSGASLGASLALLLGIGTMALGAAAVPVLAFAGAVGSVFLVLGISRAGPRIPTTSLLLAGIAVSVVISALVTLIILMAGEGVKGLFFWLMGGFNFVDWRGMRVAAPIILLGIFLIYFFSRDLNILILGEETATSLGVDAERIKKLLIVLASLITAISVSVSGVIGFVGLIIPHLVRLVVGPDHHILIPASLLAGSMFLVLADAAARTVLSPVELPVGIITAMTGGPFFIYLLRARKGRYRF